MYETTNRAIVISVSEKGCVVAVNGKNSDLTWYLLHEAATQDEIMNYANRGLSCDDTTRELAKFYRQVEERAFARVRENRALPIRYAVQQNETHVWWEARFFDVAGQWSWIPRAADEGGTLAHAWMAEREAKDRAARLRKLGYDVTEALRS